MSSGALGLATPQEISKYEPVIGLEVQVQLNTRTKMFCGSPTSFGAPPHTNVSPVCLGLPGALPMLNQRAVELAIQTALGREQEADRLDAHSTGGRRRQEHSRRLSGFRGLHLCRSESERHAAD